MSDFRPPIDSPSAADKAYKLRRRHQQGKAVEADDLEWLATYEEKHPARGRRARLKAKDIGSSRSSSSSSSAPRAETSPPPPAMPPPPPPVDVPPPKAEDPTGTGQPGVQSAPFPEGQPPPWAEFLGEGVVGSMKEVMRFQHKRFAERGWPALNDAGIDAWGRCFAIALADIAPKEVDPVQAAKIVAGVGGVYTLAGAGVAEYLDKKKNAAPAGSQAPKEAAAGSSPPVSPNAPPSSAPSSSSAPPPAADPADADGTFSLEEALGFAAGAAGQSPDGANGTQAMVPFWRRNPAAQAG